GIPPEVQSGRGRGHRRAVPRRNARVRAGQASLEPGAERHARSDPRAPRPDPRGSGLRARRPPRGQPARARGGGGDDGRGARGHEPQAVDGAGRMTRRPRGGAIEGADAPAPEAPEMELDPAASPAAPTPDASGFTSSRTTVTVKLERFEGP